MPKRDRSREHAELAEDISSVVDYEDQEEVVNKAIRKDVTGGSSRPHMRESESDTDDDLEDEEAPRDDADGLLKVKSGSRPHHWSGDAHDGEESDEEDEAVNDKEHIQYSNWKEFGDKEDVVELEPFNLKAEKEEGHFEDGGDYIRHADPDTRDDNWLEGTTKRQIKKAKEAREKKLLKEQEELENWQRHKTTNSLPVLAAKLRAHLLNEESVLQCIKRLGRELSTLRDSVKVDEPQQKHRISSSPAVIELSKKIEEITEWCDQAMALQYYEIYEQTAEQLKELEEMHTSKRRKTEDDAITDTLVEMDPRLYYKWEENGEIYGPFSLLTVSNWSSQGYFPQGVHMKVESSFGSNEFQFIKNENIRAFLSTL